MARKKSAATIARELSKEIATSPADVAKQIVESYRARREAILSGIAANTPGSKNFLDYQIQLAKLDKAERDELHARGLVPENLGVATQPNFIFTATVKTDGSVSVKLNDKDAEEDAAIRRKFDEAYGS